MRKSTVIVVAALLLLAGCSGGDVSPTEPGTADGTETGTQIEGTPTAGGDGAESGGTGSLSTAGGDNLIDSATETNVTVFNGSDQTNVLIRNDTAAGRELVELTRPSGTTAVYSTADYVAARNGTTGDVQYGETNSTVGVATNIKAGAAVIGGFLYTGFVEWTETGTTTVDGEDAVVYEGASLNESELSGNTTESGFARSDVQSVDGRAVVGPDGRIHSLTVTIETPEGTYGTEMAFRYDDITVSQPDWVDESRAP
ncbi:DUF7537 family lipoprotein [Haloarcula laminariae]|uniref:DUF7537 family lipoprotein n=1 Tax=Haloarcula laminariae TaxID=2961577 RepID=UPI0021C7FCAE|nr:hypothetical protein [Halomicroarcula laminariae]